MKVISGKNRLKFKWLTGDMDWIDHGGTWISKRLNNGDWDYWLTISICNIECCGSDDKYLVDLQAVSIEAAKDKLEEAIESCCYGDIEIDEMLKIEALVSYGVTATLWSETGNNAYKLLKEARIQATGASSMFGFYMDGPKNALGHTGWDFISGDTSLDKVKHLYGG